MPTTKFESLHTIEPAYHPKQKMGFLVDWLLTLKCNYDCPYCPIGLWGHDNSIPHPKYEKCITMLEQLYAYTDVMMEQKKENFKDAIMNIYGGESIFHPQFVEIAEQTTRSFEKYKDRWRINRRITTNGTAIPTNWVKICNHVEGVTMSYHSSGPKKLKSFFRSNLEHLTNIKKKYDVVVLMHPHEDFWDDSMEFLRYCKQNKFIARPRLLDGRLGVYSQKHFDDLSEFVNKEELVPLQSTVAMQVQARACCGGRKLCTNRDLKKHQMLAPRGDEGYKGWTCSANQFFIFGNNITGEYFTNKDCRVRLTGDTGPLAHVDTMDNYITKLRERIAKEGKSPVLTCAQTECMCGTCAPKSRSPEILGEIMKTYNTTTHSL